MGNDTHMHTVESPIAYSIAWYPWAAFLRMTCVCMLDSSVGTQSTHTIYNISIYAVYIPFHHRLPLQYPSPTELLHPSPPPTSLPVTLPYLTIALSLRTVTLVLYTTFPSNTLLLLLILRLSNKMSLTPLPRHSFHIHNHDQNIIHYLPSPLNPSPSLLILPTHSLPFNATQTPLTPHQAHNLPSGSPLPHPTPSHSSWKHQPAPPNAPIKMQTGRWKYSKQRRLTRSADWQWGFVWGEGLLQLASFCAWGTLDLFLYCHFFL